MECEVEKERGGEGPVPLLLVSMLEEQVKTAADQLLLTNFEACLEMCRHVVSAASHCDDAGADILDRLVKACESATVIAIQALAELGNWREVIPFVEQVYSHVAACPPPIMQMCLLLHAHVKEYMVCHSLINCWLGWENHSHLPESGAIVSIYVLNVLIPLKAYNLIPQVVERCTALSPVERQALLSPRPSGRSSETSLSSAPGHGDGTEGDSSAKDCDAVHDEDEHCHVVEGKGKREESSGARILSLYLNLARRLWRNFSQKGWCKQISRVSKLFFLLSLVLLALLHVQTDVTANFSRAMKVWRTATTALVSLWQQQPQKY